MKTARRFALLMIAALAALCLSASAFAAFYLPKGVREIGDEAFMSVPLPKNYAIPSGVEKIGSRAFAGTGVEMFWLPKTLKEIASDAFDKESATFVCSPGTCAESWCKENSVEYDYIKPFLKANTTSLLYGETAVLTADYVFNNEPTEYLWETRGRERYWTPVLDESGPVLRYSNTEEEGFVRFRVSAISGDESSVPSDCVTINCYGSIPEFLPDKCSALSGDSIYLEWKYMGKNTIFKLLQWFPDEQHPEGGEWESVNVITGGWNRTIYGLDKNTEYRFRIGIAQDAEADILSEPIIITTGNQPTTFEMREFPLDGNSVHMSWEPIKDAVYDVYLGDDPDNLPLFASNVKATDYHIYNMTLGRTRYIQVKARIPNTGFAFWGPAMEVTPTEEGPFLNIETCEVKGDVVSLQWTPLPGCRYDVYLRMDGGEETCIVENTSKNELDLGSFRPGEKWIVRVTAKCGRWSCSSPETEIGVDSLQDVEYRALLIGEVSFKGSMYSHRCYGDVERLTEMLENVKTPGGTHYSVIRRQDLSCEGVLSAIREAFGNADENDVSLIYFGTHGDVGHVGRFAGYLCTVEVPYEPYGILRMEEFAAAMEEIKGTKIVWLGSCGSGAGIYDMDEEENYADPYYGEYDEDEWDDWYEYEINDDADSGFFASDAAAFDTGELRLPGFQVMTAARYRYVSWGMESQDFTYFIRFLADGVYGPDGSMPADLNDDGRLTQHELFTYIKLREEDPESGADQDVQAYPAESDYVLFVK